METFEDPHRIGSLDSAVKGDRVAAQAIAGAVDLIALNSTPASRSLLTVY